MRALVLLASYFSLSETLQLIPTKSPINPIKNVTRAPRPPMKGTPQQIFDHYRCQLCLDVTIDNVDLVDGEIRVSEEPILSFCEAFLSKIFVPLAQVACRVFLKGRIDHFMRQSNNPKEEQKFAEELCHKVYFCT